MIHLIQALESAKARIIRNGSIWVKGNHPIAYETDAFGMMVFDNRGMPVERYGWHSCYDKEKVKARLQEIDETITDLQGRREAA